MANLRNLLLVCAFGSIASALPSSSDDSAGPCLRWYSVKNGDYCFKIAAEQSVSFDNLQKWNKNQDCSLIHQGDHFCVSKHPEVQCEAYHTVVRGDNCYNIARTYKSPQGKPLEAQQLVDWNRNILFHPDQCMILPGQKLCIRRTALFSFVSPIRLTSQLSWYHQPQSRRERLKTGWLQVFALAIETFQVTMVNRLQGEETFHTEERLRREENGIIITISIFTALCLLQLKLSPQQS
ncbi:hypothetical protein L249_0683 [Ophiocordyceps polyrhachis-furcata BCC 54312]|uniref:LysM domain-containing protein n=1 Tax=Ophiocordyceps polyrhachis-furcata BCC 54312 TaxID=1330021 RepID=A0A367LD28_9HYPO|nr:hypothetical protein L249_0683 [Ophiocordyceps polyrhachis-furcata BCC 54312]